MRDLVQQHAPSASFGSRLATLALYVGHHTKDGITMVVSPGEADSPQQKGVLMVSRTPPVAESDSTQCR